MEFFAGIGAGWMNLASLALGLLAWMLPVAAMIRTAARPRACLLYTSKEVGEAELARIRLARARELDEERYKDE